MPIHHIIPKHEWKKRFGNLDGVDSPDNLTPELYNHQHAQVHQLLYELNGYWQDLVAWKGTAGLIGHEEIMKEIGKQVGLSNRGKKKPPLSEEYCKRRSDSRKGVRHSAERNRQKSISMQGARRSLGCKHSLESRKARSEKLRQMWADPQYHDMMMKARKNAT